MIRSAAVILILILAPAALAQSLQRAADAIEAEPQVELAEVD